MVERMAQELGEKVSVSTIHRDLDRETNPRSKEKKIKYARKNKFSARSMSNYED